MTHTFERTTQRFFEFTHDLRPTSATSIDYLSHDPTRKRLNHIGTRIILPFAKLVMNAAELAVYLEDGSPTTVELPRVGKGGTIFYQKKTRSMRKDSQQAPTTLDPKLADDPRITRVGSAIRPLSIDELRQLYNVLAGEMSLVGPRPKGKKELELLGNQNYILTEPGITGLEQINGRGDTTPEQRNKYIDEYIDNACFELDIDIIWQTIAVVRTRQGAY